MQVTKVRVRGVVFDYGNVLCLPQQPLDVESMASLCGMAISRFRELYWKTRLRYDSGALDGNTYWGGLAREDGKVFSAAQIAELVILDATSWSRPNPATLAWLDQLRGAGLRVGLLSNMPPEIARFLQAQCDWFDRFDSLTFSCDVGQVKPGPAIYEICLKELQLPAEEVLFLDDIAVNVEGAVAVGIHGMIFDTLESTVARVGERFDVPIPSFSKS